MLSTPLLTKPADGIPIQLFSRARCCGIRNTTKRMVLLMNELDELSAFQKAAVINRFVDVLESFRGRALFYTWMFHCGRFIVTTGSLIVPALLSIQYTGQTGRPQTLSYDIYWVTWCVSLLVTTCNAILTLVKVDKKYYFLNTAVEQLLSECWHFIYLTGKYGGHYTQGMKPGHGNQYVFFCHNLEKLKLKQVEEEYFKLQDHHGDKTPTTENTQSGGVQTTGNSIVNQLTQKKSFIAGLYSPTPDQIQLDTIQRQLAEAISASRVDGGRQPPIPSPPDSEDEEERRREEERTNENLRGRREASPELPV
jgi:hypothetical protein